MHSSCMDSSKIFKEEKAQGALEYLLLIGGAVLVAAIVITVLARISGDARNTINNAVDAYNNAVNQFQ